MNGALRLTRVDFDSMENRNPEHRTELGVFMAGDVLTAKGKVTKFVESMPEQKIYYGWDGQFYPKFEIEEIEIR